MSWEPGEMRTLTDTGEIVELCQRMRRLHEGSIVAWDTETTGLEPYAGDHIQGLSFCIVERPDQLSGADAYYVPFAHKRGNASLPDQLAVLHAIRDTKAVVDTHNGNFDYHFAKQHAESFDFPEHRYDTSIHRWLQDENANKHLKDMGDMYLGIDASAEQKALAELRKSPYKNQTEAYKRVREELPELSAKEARVFAKEMRRDRGWGDLTADEIGTYAAMDAWLTAATGEYLGQRGVSGSDKEALAREIELQPILARMTRRGVSADEDALVSAGKLYEEKAEEIAGQLNDDFGGHFPKTFNPGSGPQVARLLYDVLELPVLLHTDKGARSTAKEALEMMEGHPVAQLILDYRHYQKGGTAFANTLLDYLQRSNDGRIHGMFRSDGTVTGRFSCSNPNLMTIPKESSLPEIREAFYVTEPGYERLGFDLASAELWVTAHMTRDPNLIAILQEGRDMHTEMAQLAFGRSDGRWRTLAKNVNYGMAYGAGIPQLSLYAAKAGLNPEDAKRAAIKIRAANRRMFPKMHAKSNWLAQRAQEIGYLPLHVKGRYRHFKSPGVRVEFYTALNALVQGGVAEYVKDTMLEIDRRGYGELMVLQVHDELVFDAPTGMHDEIQNLLDSITRDINPFIFPLKWEGKAWSKETP